MKIVDKTAIENCLSFSNSKENDVTKGHSHGGELIEIDPSYLKFCIGHIMNNDQTNDESIRCHYKVPAMPLVRIMTTIIQEQKINLARFDSIMNI